MSETLQNLPILFFASGKDWLGWLEENYQQQDGIWLKFAKKDSGITSLHYNEALEGALCYGWIDGQAKPYDEKYYLQRYTPRRKRSMWSKRNIALAEGLIASGKMKASGLAAITTAKEDGRWERAYDSSRTIKMPPIFEDALSKNKKAKAFYETLNKANTYAFLYRLQTAKREETKQALVIRFIKMLENGEKFH